MRALAGVGRIDDVPAFREAVAWLKKQRRDDGRWNGDSPYGD